MKQLTDKIQKQLIKMSNTGKLFRVDLNGQQIYDLYLKSFEDGDNPVFRDPASSEHNCNHCNNFIRRYGNVITIDNDNKIMSLFDIEIPGEYEAPMKAMSAAIKNSKVTEVFFETYAELNSLPYETCSKSNSVFRLGVDKNPKRYTKEEAEKFGVVKANEIKMFHHLHMDLPVMFVDMTGKSVESIMGEYREAKEVFLRGMETIPEDTLKLVRDLIIQGSLLDGTSHLHKIEKILPLKIQYDGLPKSEKDNWCWVNSYKLPYAKFRNELIGVLCTELAEGKELNAACKAWNIRVDPVNYMKASAPITARQIEEAKKFVEENGYTESFDRRIAVLGDIKASEIKHINVGTGKVKSISVFDKVKPATSTRHKRSELDALEEVPIEKFMNEILPTCTSIEALVDNNHEGNMVTLTTATDPQSKKIFKWSNNYSWTFNGNLAGKSQIKAAVASKGGKVDGVLRFSIMWAEGDSSDNSDLDAHAQEPKEGDHIYFSSIFRKDRGNTRTSMSGQLDIDITQPRDFQNTNIVENIAWSDLSKMKNGTYKLWINQFAARGSKGFKAEIEFDGNIYSYEYNRPVNDKANVEVAEVTLKDGVFSIVHKLPETASSKEIYGLQTNDFHKVNLVCLSPNHWEGNNVGNKHYFFMLDGCKCDTPIRGFHNENLSPDLLEHRKVMEVLGATSTITPSPEQLSGLGFNSTVKDELIVKVSGSFKRMLKIKF